MEGLLKEGLSLIVPTVVGIIGYFLKRTIAKADECEKQIEYIKENYATQTSVERLEKNIKEESSKFQNEIREKLDDVSSDLKDVQINYIHKNDFFKEMAKIDNKIERILDLIIERGK